MSKLVSIAVSAAILGASAGIAAQTGQSGMSNKEDDRKTFHHDFKTMDGNSDGMITRDEYLRYYGTRFDRMKRNDKGMVMMNDMMTYEGSPATKPGAPNPAGKNRSN